MESAHRAPCGNASVARAGAETLETVMAANETATIAKLVSEKESEILPDWVALQKKAGALQTGRISETELTSQSREFLHLLQGGLAKGGNDTTDPTFQPARDFLTNLSRSRAVQGFSPTETATFVFSLKQPLFGAMERDKTLSPADISRLIWSITLLLDELGLLTFETFQQAREAVILRQQREISELSTPVVKLWEGILALPVIGTLDSERTQVVMENLLQHIVDDSAEIAIIDITGVPTVDTLTAQHLLKTVAAARLMGADCIISGIRPQIAQTIVHLGVELNVISKATLADALSIALRRTGRAITKVRAAQSERTRSVDENGE
jgi:rsbT co-antagonist protein RsbR